MGNGESSAWPIPDRFAEFSQVFDIESEVIAAAEKNVAEPLAGCYLKVTPCWAVWTSIAFPDSDLLSWKRFEAKCYRKETLCPGATACEDRALNVGLGSRLGSRASRMRAPGGELTGG